jgi:2-hydroxy-6-oxonona-2,4-dienedioate hydrolase
MMETPDGPTAPDAPEVARLEASSRRITTEHGSDQTIWRVWGSGPPLILLHGGYGSWTHWIRNIDALAAGNTVYAVDMPAFGDSDKPQGDVTAGRMAELLWHSVNSIFGSETSVRIAGFSFGGVMGIRMAALHSERIERLILIGSGGYGIAKPQNVKLSRWRHLTDHGERLEVHRKNLAALMFYDADKIDDLAVALQASNTVRAQVDSVALAQSTNIPEMLSTLRVPIDGIWGACDAVSKQNLPLLRELLTAVDPACEFVVIDDAGHWVQYEAPESVNETMLRLLAQPRNRPPSRDASEFVAKQSPADDHTSGPAT